MRRFRPGRRVVPGRERGLLPVVYLTRRLSVVCAGKRRVCTGPPLRPGPGPGRPPSPIGLTAAGLFAGGEVSRLDSRMYVNRHGCLVLVVLAAHQVLMPERRRITIPRQSG